MYYVHLYYYLDKYASELYNLIAVAKRALVQKEHFEKQRALINSQFTTIEIIREKLEKTLTSTQVLEPMSGGAEALRGDHKNMCVNFFFKYLFKLLFLLLGLNNICLVRLTFLCCFPFKD